MKRFLLSITLLFLFAGSSFAAHIIGGEMRYTYLGPGSLPNTKNYRLTLWLARGETGALFATFYIAAIYNNDNGLKVPGTAGTSGNNWRLDQDNPPGILSVPIVLPSCIQGAPVLNYTYATYSTTVDLPDNLNGYTVAYQTCCRIDGMINVGNSVGSTYSCSIPGSNQLGAGNDSSPAFGVSVNVVCKNAPFTLNFAAIDLDAGDSLVYSLCSANNGGAATDASFDNPSSPPYPLVPYNFGYSSSNPFGTGATIDIHTGIISGMAPNLGRYVVCVCIDVYRDRVRIATHKKDLIVQVSDCVLTVANPMPDFTTCDGFTLQFSHSSTGANTVFWNFGDPTTLADTSLSDNPSWDYSTAGAGTYIVKLIINKGTSCVDSVTRTIGVFPGFFPGFQTAGGCFTNPFHFTDTTKTNYGVVDTWSWNFGDETTLADTSHLQHPQWTFSTPGPKTVTLTVSNSKGCTDIATFILDVLDKPLISMDFKDTLICIPDAITLGATGTGTFNWTPLTSIVGANTSNPTVNPTTDTWYVAHLNDNGCLNKDSVHVRVVANVTLSAMGDTTICLTDAVQLNANTDGLTFQWTPDATLDDPTIVNPIATPVDVSTTYKLRATIGTCFATDDVTITTVAYPVANAGPPQTICYNASAQLNGSHDGISFTWTPPSYLNNPNILNPVSSPPRTTSYVLTVLDNAGCPKPGRDTVVITVLPKVSAYAGRDTIVVIGQPLQFNGSGGVNYTWNPSTGLSSTTIHDPIGVYNSSIDSIRYKLIVTDAFGCADSAFVKVTVFKTKPYIFVPTAFTPNNDGKNDIIAPICAGILRMNYFSIYNRWGQLVFTTTSDRAGWDGRINGKTQDTGVYVWMVSAIDYLGVPIFLKGTVALIR
ncbi:MAG TPA: PKD domain-containing protein [Chitinophagaceae bacterium]|nr:PKD domain-containing protein [Chitinophagaceae bacterium]